MKLVWFLTIVFVHKSIQDDEDTVVVGVTRRLLFDIYFDHTGNYNTCSQDSKVIYLVEDRQCVTEQDLLKECSSAIIPVNSTQLIAIANPSISSSIFTLVKADGEAIFHFRETSQSINSSLCQISSLEVYRGREQAIEISHQGFSVGYDATIKINYDAVTYVHKDYVGELYCMNLSCSGRGLPESGCLFFKVPGLTNISEAKFNGSVPGTLPTSSSECPPTTTLSTSHEMSPATSSNLLFPTSVSDIPNFQSYNSVWFALLLGVGIILIIILSVVCVVVEFQNRRQSQSRTTAIQPQDQGAVTAVQLDVQKNPAYIQLGPTETPQAAIVPDYHSENPAYNIDPQQRPHEEPMYEVIPDRSTPHTVQGAQNVHCDQNPAYIHVLGIHAEERLPTDQLPQCSDYSQNPAYGIHSSHNN